MIDIVEVTVEGTTEAGSFRGSMSFGSGLQVVAGPNRYGKSLAFAAFAWCLGVEHIFGVQAGDNSIFPDAARTRVTLDDAEETVAGSSAVLVLRRHDGTLLRLRRAIVGDASTISYTDDERSGNLVVGRGTMTDPIAGFQATFRKWARLPDARLLSSRGVDVPIYLENLAPLFLIEQLGGWVDIQAEQVHRYRTLEIEEGAFEFLLGLDESLKARLRKQGSGADAAAVREEARNISASFADIMTAQGWAGELGVGGALDAVVTRWEKLDLFAFVKDRFHFDPSAEQQRVVDRVEKLRTRITRGKIDTDSTAETVDASAQVVAIKQRRHELQLLLATLRAQLREQQDLHSTIEGRLKSAKDLRRLKVEQIGILPKAECPTCHQSVDPAHLELSGQSVESLELHVSQLDRERLMLGASVERLRGEVLEVATKATRLDEDLISSEQSLKMVNQTVGPARETIVKLTGDLVAAERDVQRTRDLQAQLDALQGRIAQWITRAKVAAFDEAPSDSDRKTLAAFVTQLRKYLVDLGCVGVSEDSASDVNLDEQYTPTYHGRLLRSFGSASDRARLITAFVAALNELGRHHPGFAVLDEPLQQNPDPDHRKRFLDFLGTNVTSIKRQLIVFTALDGQQIEGLRKAGVGVQVFQGKFLRRVVAPSPVAADPSSAAGIRTTDRDPDP